MRYVIYFIVFFNALSFGSYVCASESQGGKKNIMASLVLESENDICCREYNEKTWKRFGIAFDDNADQKVIFVKHAKTTNSSSGNQIDWCNIAPISIQESGESITDSEILGELHHRWVEKKGGGMVYRFPTVLPKSLFLDENGQVKKEIILNFPVGKDLYEAHLILENPEKINIGLMATLQNMLPFQDHSTQKNSENCPIPDLGKHVMEQATVSDQESFVDDKAELKQSSNASKIFGGFLTILAATIIGYFYTKSV